jgi:hypothetical protein
MDPGAAINSFWCESTVDPDGQGTGLFFENGILKNSLFNLRKIGFVKHCCSPIILTQVLLLFMEFGLRQ